MSHDLLNSVAATTTHRDRDDLDRAIAGLLLQFLELHSVTVVRLSDEGDVKRIVRCVSLSQRPGAVGPAQWTEIQRSPRSPTFRRGTNAPCTTKSCNARALTGA